MILCSRYLFLIRLYVGVFCSIVVAAPDKSLFVTDVFPMVLSTLLCFTLFDLVFDRVVTSF